MGRFVLGVVIGGAAAFVLGYNFGRGVAPLTNPLATRTALSVQLKRQAGEFFDSARAAIHKATAPPRRPAAKPPER